MNLRLSPLHTQFGVEVHDVDLRDVTAELGYPEIRAAFEAHSLLLFRDQQLDDRSHLAFGALWGPIEDRSMDAGAQAASLDNVTNRLADGTVAAADSLHLLDLTGNQLWHTDSTFLPTPALANILAARMLSTSGGETEFTSTRAAWRDLPDATKHRLRASVIRHRLAHSRSTISADLVAAHLARWPDQTWRAVWRNPANGCEALYIASHAVAVEGMPETKGRCLIEDLIAFCTQPDRVYTHRWRTGDVLVWDERATMHRGRPWPYEEERTLASICISAGEVDGVGSIRP